MITVTIRMANADGANIERSQDICKALIFEGCPFGQVGTLRLTIRRRLAGPHPGEELAAHIFRREVTRSG